MKVASYGATGRSGGRILKELLSRGDKVIAVARNPAKVAERGPSQNYGVTA